MNHQTNPVDRTEIRAAIGARLRAVREELYGEHGLAEIAERLGLPVGTWANYERGVTIPGDVLLHYLEITGAQPSYLLTGVGARYRPVEP